MRNKLFIIISLLLLAVSAHADDIMDFSEITPLATDQVWLIDDPGGTPVEARAPVSALFTAVLGSAYDTEAELTALFAAKQDNLTFGIADDNAVEIDQAAGAADDEIARFTANGIEGLSYAELAAVAGFESALEGALDLEDMQGAVTDGQVPDNITIDLATLATTVTISDDESTDDEHEITFTTDNVNLESDGDFTYNPSTGTVTAAHFVGELEGADLDIINTTAEASVESADSIIMYDSSAAANRRITRGNFLAGLGVGQAIILDIEDDGGNDSTDLGEIATKNDTNNVVTMPTADKMYIDMAQNWPGADLADTIVVADDESTAANHAVLFVQDLDGSAGIAVESDGDFYYNPSTGQLAVTSVYTTGNLVSGGSFVINAVVVGESELGILDGATVTTAELNILDGATVTYSELNILDGATLSYTDLNVIDGVGDSGTLTAAELLYVDGVTSSIQTQLDARCLESVFGDGIEADDLELSGTTLQLAAEIPHLDVAETIAGNWVNTANPWADNEVSDTLTVGNAGSVDPDALAGDTTDDDLVDQDVIEGFAGVSDPFVNLRDSDAEGADEADEEAARIYANMITTTEDAEDVDLWFTVIQGGTRTTVLLFDESDDQWETTKNFEVPADAYNATTWNGNNDVPTKDAIRDKIEGLAGTGTMTTVEDGDSQVGGADIVTLDFDGTVFNITESPDTEINIDIADDGIDSQHYASASVDPEHVSSGAWDFGTSVEADTLTENGNAVYNSSEEPGGILGGTWATPTIDSSAITFSHLAADAKFQALAVADLNDTSTPHVLTTEETTNKVISNYASSGADRVFTMPAAHAAGNVIFPIGDEYQVDIEPDSGTAFYLNGTAMATDEHIQNTADTLGERIVGYCVSINGTLTWMFYSSDSNWVEESP